MAVGDASGNSVKSQTVKDVSRIFAEDGHLIDEALRQGVHKAMLRHKKDGLSVVIYRDGRAAWLRPEELGF